MNAQTGIPRQAIFLLIALTFVWGTNWPLFRLATAEVSVWTFRSVALLASGLTLLGVARLQGHRLGIARIYWWRIGAATSLYLVMWNVTSTYAALMIPSGQAAILGFTMPLWSGLLTVLVLRERLETRLVLALLLGAACVGLLMSRSLSAYAQAPLGFFLGLLSGLGWAVGTMILKARKVDVPPIVLTGWQLTVSAVPISLVALWLGDHQWFWPSWKSIAVISYIALVPMCIGNLCWFTIVGMLSTNTAGISSIMVPMVAMVSGALLNGEPLGPVQWLAMLCSGAALALVMLRPRAQA